VLVATVVVALGVPGVAGATKWAVVSAGGTVARGHGVKFAAHLGRGTYSVGFNADVTACAYVATVGDTGTTPVADPIGVAVARYAAHPRAIFVQTRNLSTAALEDTPFHVAVYCAATAKFAVVGSDGVLDRGAGVTGASRLGTGSYQVAFDRDVSSCAWTATIGTTAVGTVPSPGGITVVRDASDPHAVVVTTIDRHGALADSAFHMAVNCGPTRLIAVVRSDGTTARGVSVASSAKLSPVAGDGRYEVVFDRDVSACAFTGTIGRPGHGSAIAEPIELSTASRDGNPAGVYAAVHVAGGGTADRPFHLTVWC